MTPTSVKKKNILIVDDERAVRDALGLIFLAQGCAVQEAGDGFSGLTQVAKHLGGEARIDLILLDLMMPGMSGSVFLRELGRLGSEIPVLIFSAYTDQVVLPKEASAFVKAIIAKPFTEDVLLAATKEVLN